MTDVGKRKKRCFLFESERFFPETISDSKKRNIFVHKNKIFLKKSRLGKIYCILIIKSVVIASLYIK